MNPQELVELLRRTGCIVAVVSASTASAQESQQLDRVEVLGRGTKPGLALDQPSDTGSRTGITLRELPASLEVLSVRSVQERGDYAVRDAVSRTTGLTDIASPGDGGMAFSARGFTGTNSVGLAENGARLAVAAGTQTYPSDSWGYERFEVLRGPASVVFGNGTVGATINAIRKPPQRESSLETLAALGDHGSGRVGIGGTGSLGEITSFRVDGYATTTDGVRDLGRARSRKLMSALRIDPAPDLRFEVMADYSLLEPERYWGTPLVDGRIDPSLRKQNYDVSDGIVRYEDKRLRARAQWQAAPGLTLSDELYFLEANRHWRNVEQYALDPATRLVERSSYLEILHDQRQRGNRIEASFDGAGHRVVGGWEHASIDFRHTNNFPAGGTSTVADRGFDHGTWSSTDATAPKYASDTTIDAVYVEDAYRLGDQWLLLGGVRYDSTQVSRVSLVGGEGLDKTLAGTALRLGITYKLDAERSAYAQASSGHDPVASLVTLNLGSRDFKLTTGRQVEVGFKQSFAEQRGNWTAAAYRIDKSDIITQDPVHPEVSIQGGKQHSQGIELAADVTPSAAWRLEGNLALVQARFDQLVDEAGTSRAGNRPPDVPARVANLWLHWSPGPWRASLGARHVGKRFGDNANSLVLPGYTAIDAGVSWKASPSLTLRGLARNVADKTFAIATYGPTQVILGELRRFELVAELSF